MSDKLSKLLKELDKEESNKSKKIKSLMEDVDVYMETLENGLSVLCNAVGVDSDRYDTDQADVACYADCFKEMAELLEEAGVYYDKNHEYFKIRENKKQDELDKANERWRTASISNLNQEVMDLKSELMNLKYKKEEN